MKFLSQVKLNYNTKLIDEYFNNHNYKQIYELIDKLKNKPDLYFDCLLHLNKYLKNLEQSDFYFQKIIWVASYEQTDAAFINNFLNYYLTAISQQRYLSTNYVSYLSEVLEIFNFKNLSNLIEFNQYVPLSNLFQNLLIFNSNNKLFSFDTCAAFFEDKENNYFLYPNKTQCYFYLFRNPLELFTAYKKFYPTKEATINYLFNVDDEKYLNKNLINKKYKLYENRTNLNTNFNSWTDPNVVSTFRGKIINLDQLIKEPEEVLVDVIFHIKQSGLEIEIDYDLITKFVKDNPISQWEIDNFSVKETKMLLKNIHNQLAKQFNI